MIRNCNDAYEFLLRRLVLFPSQNKDSLLNSELIYIQSNYMDTSQIRLKLESIINKTYIDSFTLLLNSSRKGHYYYDSINNLNNLEKIRQQEISDSIWDNINYPTFENMNDEEKREYLADQDTTLWKDIYEFWTPDPLDDGMRFDTFSNAELVTFLDTFSYLNA